MSEALTEETYKALKDYVDGGGSLNQYESRRMVATIELQKSDIKLGAELVAKIKEVKEERNALSRKLNQHKSRREFLLEEESEKLKIDKRKNAELWQETEADLAKLKLEFKACEITNAFLQNLVNGLSEQNEKLKVRVESYDQQAKVENDNILKLYDQIEKLKSDNFTLKLDNSNLKEFMRQAE